MGGVCDGTVSFGAESSKMRESFMDTAHSCV